MTQDTSEVEILIVGGGAVGMTLAVDLAWRGVPCHLVEAERQRPVNPRCNTTAARSMEHYRRLGLAGEIRSAGLPETYPTTISYRTRVVGDEIFRLDKPSPGWVRSAAGSASWPTPEPQHRISQMFLEPILEARARSVGVSIERGTRLTRLSDDGEQVTVALESADGSRTVCARYVVGCDGAHSAVRRALGIRYAGVDAIRRFVSTYVRSPELGRIMAADPAWTTWSYNRDGLSSLLAIDGNEMWLNHCVFPPDYDTSGEDPEELLVRTVGRPVAHEQIGTVRWTGRQLVADSYRQGRVMLAGDAAHIWIPIAGFGMNAGIQDATDLAWKLAAIHHGWAGDGLLDSYELERRPIGDQVARAVGRQASRSLDVTYDGEELEAVGASGRAARDRLAAQLAVTEPARYDPVGLNFGYHYADSPLVCPAEAPAPELEIDRYEPLARPGFRLPHLWREDGSSIFDQLGADFTLVRTGPTPVNAGAFHAEAHERGIPLAELDVPEPAARAVYLGRLLLVRPDQHVAWVGDELPVSPGQVLDRATGAAV
jgi:2-polyprenyl-6-methoxyphenol hydroxylase-like FAD-dependent oxidoreductase